ncbi:hypothetical protein OG345_34145 [Streptomyces sp. NBC_01220]|uniref:hypothetical protein n=1 Tax=Streptomyces sp. NBC_01220 TaxID=2903781 RepID=UPI00352EF55D|nr:hypothetical protein OG345_34145 [Streptomyces sp. NBC_01220]
MSGSPKYSTVMVAPAYARIEAQRRRAREAQRRRQRAQRDKERAEQAARRAAEAAARRERARATAARRETELADRRAAREQAHAQGVRQEQAAADTRRLAEVRELLDRVRAEESEVRSLRQRLDDLRAGVGRAEDVGGAIEELRGRVVVLGRDRESPGRDADQGAVMAGLESRLAGIGAEARAQDPQGHQNCVDLLGELRTAARPGAETRFRALLGTVEHALARHAAIAGERAAQERRRAERAREAEREAQERAAVQEAAAQAELEDERERLAATFAEAEDRLRVVRASVEEAADDARELADPELAERIEAALAAVTDRLAAGAPAEALTAVAALEDVLVGAEVRLDDLQAAFTRRMDLAQALQDAMLGEGFAFTGGDDRDGRLLLSFERPSGATYRTTITTGDGGAPLLVYQVDGEPDVTLRPEPDGAVCDRTEDLLERVHEAIVVRDGFVPGELTWQGKPPGRHARQVPGAGEWRWTR